MSVGLSFLAALLLAALPLFTVGPMIWLAQRSHPGAGRDVPPTSRGERLQIPPATCAGVAPNLNNLQES